MTCLNLGLGPIRATIAVDTIAFNVLHNKNAETSKLVYIPHVNAVLAARGVTVFLHCTWGILLPQDSDYDEIAEGLPQAILHARTNACTMMGTDAPPEDTEFIWIGWSPKQGRMAGFHYLLKAGSTTVTSGGCPDGTHIAPKPPDLTPPRDLSDRKRMREVMKGQVQYGLAQRSSGGFGGRMIMVNLLKDEARFTTISL